jgi:hypothetical protein
MYNFFFIFSFQLGFRSESANGFEYARELEIWGCFVLLILGSASGIGDLGVQMSGGELGVWCFITFVRNRVLIYFFPM